VLRATLASLIALAVLAGGCGSNGAGATGSVGVVATTTQAADLVQNVVRGRAEVERLLEPNSDPHEYEPRPSDARGVADANVIFRSGGDLDEWLDGLIDNAGGDAEVVTLVDSVRRIEGDPHWWQDPLNAVRGVEAIRAAMVKADPDGRETYDRNAERYTARLRRLDRTVSACMERVPKSRRKLVTTHDALGYFARRYDIEVVGALIPSRSTAAQPSARETQRLVDQIRKEKVRAIFPESSLNPKLERAVARETGAKVGDPLWADALGPEGSSGATYLGSVKANADALAKGMTGTDRGCR
jgi:ABC-type Zn uptake system ZnuABC Zn-binding protein ZnuA